MKSDNGVFSKPEDATAYEFDNEFDLAPPLTIKEAAEATRRFMKDLPDDITDVDLGSDL